MSTEACRICGEEAAYLFNALLIKKFDVAYFECRNCGYVQTQNPYWLSEAYADAINVTDTGILRRNLINSRIVQVTLKILNDSNNTVVDFAGGYGILVRQLRDVGVNALWRDQYCSNLLARGFEHTDQVAVLATAFEAFEHFVEPIVESARIQRVAPNTLLSTVLIPEITPKPQDWWYYGLDHGQHIGFFRLKTLKYLANTLGSHLCSDGQSYHLLTARPVHQPTWRLLRKFNALMSFGNILHRDKFALADYRSIS